MNKKALPAQKVPVTPESRKISWRALMLMGFMTVWGFGNVVNGYAYFNGVKSIFSWAVVFLLYFVPYTLMVGEMGSVFKTEGGGVSSWVEKTFNKRLAYYAGWTYWIVHMPYISQKPLNVVIAAGWAIWGDKRVSGFNVLYVQIVCLLIFAIVLFLSQFGISMVKRICSLGGIAGLLMSILFVIMAVSAPFIRGEAIAVNSLPTDVASYVPDFNLTYFTSFSILIFAVGGCEKISPYVNKMKDPGKGFPKGIIFMTVTVMACAVLGTIALALMFDPTNPPKDMVSNGAYEAFQRLGAWYGVGNFFVILYALSIAITNFAVMILSIDAPLRILIESADDEFIPAVLKVKNRFGSYKYGIGLIAVIVVTLLVIPMFGIGQVNEMVSWLVKLNSVCMPLRYLWVFVAYFGLKKLQHVEAEYRMTKNVVWGKTLGVWCFVITAASCLFGMYNSSPYLMLLNIVTPFVLLALGLILPYLAKTGSLAAKMRG